MRKSILGICLGLGIIFTPITVALSLPETVQQKIDNGREAMLRGDYKDAIAKWEEAKKSLISRRSTERLRNGNINLTTISLLAIKKSGI